MAYRQEAPVVFVNARAMTDRLRDLAVDGVKVVVIDATPIPSVDSTGFAALGRLRDELDERGVELWTVNPSIRKRALIDNEAGLLDATLPKRFDTLDEAVADFEARH